MRNATHWYRSVWSILSCTLLCMMCVPIYSNSLYDDGALTCNRSPVITCPQNYFGCQGDDTTPDAVGWATAVAGEEGCDDPVISYTDRVEGTDECNGGRMIKRLWRADYPDNADPWLFAECTQIIFLEDEEDPIFSQCPTDITVSSDESCSATVTWTIPKATDDCEIESIVSTHDSGDTFAAGATTVTYTATDKCGRIATCSFVVTVIEACCTDAPEISCPADVTLCINESTDPAATGAATASFSSGYCGDAQISYSDVVVISDDCAGERVITRTWTATHESQTDLVASCVQTITIEDTDLPVINNCPSDIYMTTASAAGLVVGWATPIAQDACGIASFSSTHQPSSVFPVGTTTVTYTAIDQCGETVQCSFDVVVKFVCDDAPEISCPADYTGCVGGDLDPDVTGSPAVSQTSTYCGTLTTSYSDETLSTGSCAGARVIRRTWTVQNTDDADLSASCTQLITLSDVESPVITDCPDGIYMSTTSVSGLVVSWTVPTATDDCGIASIVGDRQPSSVFPIGTTTVSYTITDQCGNVATCSFDVVVDFVGCGDAPQITCPVDYSGCVSSSIDPSVTGQASVSTSSSCSTPEITYTDETVSTGPCDGARVIRRTWTATDPSDSDLRSSCVQIITLLDDEAPVISACPSDVTLTSESPVYTWSDPTVSDDCSYTLSSTVSSGHSFPIGETIVTITATDACGNASSCSFKVTVTEENIGSSLTINCPDDIVVLCEDDNPIDHIPLPEVDTDCEVCTGGEIPGFIYMGSYNGHKYYCSKDKDLWPNAKQVCEQNGGYLAIINSAEENAYVASLLRASSAYIGLQDKLTEGTFSWVDGSSLSYTNWYPNQPNNYKGYQDYVEILPNGLWNDQYNNRALEYVMEIPCYTIQQTAGPTDLSQVTEPTTVSYEVSDACGNVQTCSFSISVQQSVSMSCSQDIETTVDGDYAAVSYDEPVMTTCCTSDFGARELSGYVYMGRLGDSYYYCSRDDLDWHHANLTARRLGGHLAVISSAEENQFLANQLVNQTAFIGISDHEEEGVFTAVNNEAVNYTNWEPDQPNNSYGVQHYVALDPYGRWNDIRGDQQKEYIIELPADIQYRLVDGLPSGAYFPVGTTTVTYEAYDACGNVATCSFDVTVNQQQTGGHAANYCNTTASNSDYAYIQSGILTNKLFTTGNNHGYKDLTSHCVTVEKGGELPIKFSPGFHSLRYYCYWHFYIDYNGDGDFNDERELIGTAKSPYAVAGKLPILSSAVTGPTRMRVVMSLSRYPDSACADIHYGEVEDYCLNIVSSTAPKNSYKQNVEPLHIEETVAGVSDFGAKELSVYPNPASDWLQIDLTGANAQSLKVYDTQGRLQTRIMQQNDRVDISSLRAGVYILQITDHEGVTRTQRFIVHR